MRKQLNWYVNNLIAVISTNHRVVPSTGTLIVRKRTQGIPPLKRRNGNGDTETEVSGY